MTREEAKIEIHEIADENLMEDGIKLVNKIYDDFEQRTCKNCKWSNEIPENCSLLICGNSTCEDVDKQGQYVVRSTFGCNKFEKK